MGYTLLGRAVWYVVRWLLRDKYGGTPRKLGAAVLVAGAVGAILVAQRKSGPGAS
jgi:hypothetical protein